MVVIVLVFLLVIGLVFYFKISRNSITEELRYREDMGSVTLAKRVLALPEIRCGDWNGGDTCIDELKLKALADILRSSGAANAASRAYYGMLFEYATIRVELVDSGQSFPLYNDRPEGNVTMRQQFIFTTLYDPVVKRQQLAFLNVTRYTREIS
jgi:hypothetical protein